MFCPGLLVFQNEGSGKIHWKGYAREARYRNVVRVNELSGMLERELSGTAFPLTEAFLDRVENNAEYHDADKLAFRNVFDELTAAVKQHPGANRPPRILPLLLQGHRCAWLATVFRTAESHLESRPISW